MPPTESGAVILAGGGSRRFAGGEKALAEIDGQPLLVHAVDAARRRVDRTPIVAVATADQRDRYANALEDSVRFVTDAPEASGPLAGLERAVEAATAEWLLLLGCDMPLVESAVIEWLAGQRADGTDAVVARTTDGLHPLHAWYRRGAVATALDTDRGEQSLHALLDELRVSMPSASDAPEDLRLERSVCNVNTRDDLAEARRLSGK